MTGDNVDRVCALGVDLGAKNTGVVSFVYHPGEDPIEGVVNGHVIRFPDSANSWWDQSERRQKRHMRRGCQRKKLARRLLKIILTDEFGVDFTNLDWKTKEYLYGLLKRRGFTYQSGEEAEASVLQLSPDELARFFEEFSSDEDIDIQLGRLSTDHDVVKQLRTAELFVDGKRGVKSAVKDAGYEGEELTRIVDGLSGLSDWLSEIDRNFATGHRHRSEYFKEIDNDLRNTAAGKSLCSVLQMESATCSRLVAHISNFQLRMLRWYFNDASMANGNDRWDSARFSRVFWRWLGRWQVKGDEVRRRHRAELLALKKSGKTALDTLLSVSPELTIPPYENQNNRRPVKCQTLRLSINYLQEYWPHWERWVERLAKSDSVLSEKLGNEDQSPGQWSVSDKRDLLQRVLDRSRRLDRWSLRLLASGTEKAGLSSTAEIAMNELKGVLEAHTDTFIDFAREYYAEAAKARRGVWSIESTLKLFEKCNRNTGLKSNQRERLLAAVLGIDENSIDASSLEKMLQETRIGRKGLKGVLASCAEAQKSWGNELKHQIEEARALPAAARNKEQKELIKLESWVAETAQAIGKWLEIGPDRISRFSNPFSLAQLHNILFADIKGFSRTCKSCSSENAWRSYTNVDGHANASRLPADSVRPFDGHVRGSLVSSASRVARWHAELIASQMDAGERVHVPLLLEQNAFRFAADMYQIKRRSRDRKSSEDRLVSYEQGWLDQKRRLRDDANGICAYTGDSLTDSGEIDHILPRAETLKLAGTVFNSEANLIYVSSEGNRKKKDRRYTLHDLKPRYLEKQFNETDVGKIQGIIHEVVRPYLQGEKSFTSLVELDASERKAFRHALFDPELARELVTKVLSRRSQTRVNGTQAYWAHEYIQRLRSSLERKGISLASVRVIRVPPDELSRSRMALADDRPDLLKQEYQSVGSHVVDAAMTMAAVLNNPSEMNSMQTAVPDELIESAGWLMKLVPERFSVNASDRRSSYRTSRPWSRALFKDTHYAERFLHVVLMPDGEFRVGFSHDNAAPVIGSPKGKTEEAVARWYENISPYLEMDRKAVPRGAAEIRKLVEDKGKPLQLHVNRGSAFELFRKVCRQVHSDEEWRAAQLLDDLRFVTARKEVRAILADGNRAASKEKIESRLPDKFPLNKGTINLKGGMKIGYGKREVNLPFRRDWKRVINHPDVMGSIGDPKRIEEIKWDKVWKDSLKLPARARRHQPKRQTFSLPVPENVSGGFRLARQCPDRGVAWQLVAVDSNAYVGFEPDEEGLPNFRRPVVMPLFSSAGNVVPVTLERYTGSAADSEIACMFDEWKSLWVEDFESPAQTALQSVDMCPNSKSRCKIRMRINPDVAALISGIDMGNSLMYQLPGEFALLSSDVWKKQLSPLPEPRGKIAVIECSRNAVTLEYIAKTTPSWMQDAYRIAWLAG